MGQGLKKGTVLHNGNYRIEEILGQGGFGITYLAVDLTLERKVAIKEFFPKDYCDRSDTTSQVSLGTESTAQFVNKLKEKFLKEAKNIAKFDHPGIIKIHAAFEENNTAYYVMDYIDGESLSAIVKRDGPLPREAALRYITKVGKALEYVHSRKINHLDVKPANIMVKKANDEPLLIDFGLSKQYDTDGYQTSTTPTGISHGYAPMEQYNAGGVSEFSPQTDLYSLAATLYYILSGTVPPQATRLVDEELIFPETIPDDLIPAIAKGMSTARRKRQETIGKFLEEINDSAPTEIIPEPKKESQPEPEKKPEKKPEPKKDTQKELKPASNPKPKTQPAKRQKASGSSDKKWYLVGAAIGVVIIVLVAVFWPKGNGKDTNKSESTTEVLSKKDTDKKTVSGLYYKSSLGACSYTGEVDADSKPDGKGKATWESGLGKSYDGQWVHGEMDGECTYISRGGYKFEGTFKNGHYAEGKLTAPDGTYYEGSFDKDGNKWTGTEYDAKGNKVDSWKDGE